METNAPVAHRRILLVEDDRLERMNLTLVLGRGFDLDVAANATEAYALLAGEHYALVLTDIRLPDGDGFEVLHAAKRVDTKTKVVLMTGSQTAVTQEQALLEGAESLLLKPFALATILDTVRGLMGVGVRAS